MPYGIVYLAQNKLNGKVYVGQTTQSLQARWDQHRRDSRRRRNYPFQNAIRKYGADSFTVSTLAIADNQESLNEMEIQAVNVHGATDSTRGYNVRAGGESGGALSMESREKIRQFNLGRPANNKGKKMPAHQLAAMIERFREKGHPCKGKPCSPETRAKIGLAQRGRIKGPSSPETKQKQSESHKLRLSSMSEAERKAEKSTRLGVPRPQAVRKKISDSHSGPERVAKRAEIVASRNAGKTWDQISEIFGIAPRRARKVVQFYGAVVN